MTYRNARRGLTQQLFLRPLREKVGEARMRGSSKAFTLIELLVVVLIIGILAAVAVPQYQKAVEKARMSEAIILLRAIANAHQVYYLAHGEYLGPHDIEKLDIQIPGKSVPQAMRIQTKNFVYAPNGCGASCTDPDKLSNYLALATRISPTDQEMYSLFINQANPVRVNCKPKAAITNIQEKLCDKINESGTL